MTNPPPVVVSSLFLLLAAAAHGQVVTWGNVGTDFNTAANWTGNTLPGNASVATFGGTATVQPGLSSALTVSGLNFSTTTGSGYNLTATGGAALTLLSTATGATGAISAAHTSGTNTVSAPLVLGAAASGTQTFTLASGGTLTLNGTISSTNNVTLGLVGGNTSSLFNLNAANTYTGSTVQGSAGTIVIGNQAAFGTSTVSFTRIQAGADLSGANKLSNNVVLTASPTILNTANALEFGGAFDLGGAARTITMSNAGGLTLSGVISNGVSTGALNIPTANSGLVTLSGANTFLGAFTTSGTGKVSVATIGASGTGGNLGAGSTINLGAGTSAGNLLYTGPGETTDRTLNLNGTTGGATLDASGSGALIFSSALTATGSGAKTITLTGTNTAANQIQGAIVNSSSGTTAVTKSGAGTWVLSGNNTFTGALTVNNGTLKLGATDVIADTVNVVLNAITAGTTATFDLDGFSDTIGTLSFGGTGATSTSTATVALGAGTLTLGGDVTSSATGNPLGATVSGAGALALGGNRTFAIGDSANATNDLTVSATITGSGFLLTKTGSGTLALSGANTYSGGTAVNGGTLAANSASALGTGVTTINSGATVALASGLTFATHFTVNSGGTLTGASATALSGIINGAGGTLGGTLTLASGGSIAPGSSPGTLAIAGAVTFASGSRYTWELNAFNTASPGTNFDQLLVATGGTLTLNSGALLVPTFVGTAASPATADSFWNASQTWTVATNTGGTITGTALGVNNSAWSTQGAFATSLASNEILLTWTPSAIPEPTTYAAIAGLIVFGAAIWRRERTRTAKKQTAM